MYREKYGGINMKVWELEEGVEVLIAKIII